MKWPLSKFNGSPEFSSWKKRIEIKQQQKFNKRVKKNIFTYQMYETGCRQPDRHYNRY